MKGYWQSRSPPTQRARITGTTPRFGREFRQTTAMMRFKPCVRHKHFWRAERQAC